MAKNLVLADERRGDVLRDHEPGVEAAVTGEKRWQSFGEAWIHEALHAALGDVRELGGSHGEHVERKRERLAVEVAVRDEHAVVDEHERVVRGRVELDADGVVDVVEEIAGRAVHLGGATQRVRVLDLVAPAVGLDDRGVGEQTKDVRGGGKLATERPELVDLRQEARARALQRFKRLGARQIGRLGQPPSTREAERGERGHELRSR